MKMDGFWAIAYLLLPLLGGGVFHGLCMRYGWLSVLARPIDCGYTIRGRPLFGANKTFRGPVAVGVGTAIVLGLQATVLHRLSGVRQIGAWLVFAFVLEVRLAWVLLSVVLAVVVHQLLTSVTYALGMRASPW